MAVDLSWQEQASCLAAPDFNLAFLLERGHQEAGNLLPHELWDLNRANFDAFKSQYCDNCPVRQECWSEGERTEDAIWTIRGGNDPIAFESERPEEPSNKAALATRASIWTQDASGVWRCPEGHAKGEETVYFKSGQKFSRGNCLICRGIKRRQHS